jgi:predicted GNAT superfamily acetyltransferase
MFNFFKKKNPKNDSKKINIFYNERNALIIYFKCAKCGELFKSYLRKGYDLINDYDNDGFIIDKEYIGAKCPNRIHLHAILDRNYNVIDYTLENGNFITKEEWEIEKNESING